MNKLNAKFLEKLNTSNCCFDDFLILPPDGDVGLEEYVDCKVKAIIDAKKIYSPANQHKLMLAYPHPGTPDKKIFNLFFESPSVVAKNHQFEGCFAIDITDYIDYLEHPRFTELMSYISNNTHIAFVLVVCSSDRSKTDRMFNIVCQYDNFRKVVISLPTCEELTKYTIAELLKITVEPAYGIKDALLSYYSKGSYGFDAADILVLYLKNEGFDGSVESFNRLLDRYENMKYTTNENSKIGF